MTADDLKMVRNVIRTALREADIVQGHYRAKMDPKPIPWHQAADLAATADDAAYWLGQLIREVERLGEYERLWKELEVGTRP
jgi:hypothetical protein